MTSAFRARRPWHHITAWTVFAAMLLPSLLACASAPALPAAPVAISPRGPEVARLDGIVIDGSRLAQAREGGFVAVIRDGVRQDGYPGMSLQAGDRVETGPRADAVLRYPTGTEVIMRPESGGRIGSLTDVIGEVFVKVKGLFSVDTTFVRAGARGTSYLVRSFPGGATSIVVFEGVVEVDSTIGAWSPVLLGAGTMALAHPRAPQATPASSEELARTRDWVEHVASLDPPPGVSRTGVVAAVAIGAVIAGILASRGNDRPRDSTPSPRDPAPPQGPPPPREPPPVRIEPPRAISPGTARTPGPQLDCRRGVMLRWSAVAGARAYVVAMEGQAARRGWSALRVSPTRATQVRVSAEQGLAYANRWSVRARGANDGPPSQTLHFVCDFSGVR